MPRPGLIPVLTCLLLLLSFSASFGGEIRTRYTTITYDREESLRKFNDQLYTGHRFSFFFSKRQEITAAQEAGNKVDEVIDRVKTILEMYPSPLSFKIHILASASEVQKIYQQRYRKSCDYIAFYSPAEQTIFISARNAELRVFAHEVAHVVIHHYFKVAPSSKVHEVLAQYVEEHIAE